MDAHVRISRPAPARTRSNGGEHTLDAPQIESISRLPPLQVDWDSPTTVQFLETGSKKDRSDTFSFSSQDDQAPKPSNAPSFKETECSGPFTEPRYLHSLPLPFCKAKHPPPPPPASLDDARLMPDTTASILSLITFSWVTRIMALGAARQLAPQDLYRLRPEWEANVLSERLDEAFLKRTEQAELYNARLDQGEIDLPISKKIKWIFGWGAEEGRSREEKIQDWNNRTGRKKPNLVLSLSDTLGWYYWSAGLLKVSVSVPWSRLESLLMASSCTFRLWVTSPRFQPHYS